MKHLLEYILTQIVDHADKLVVEEQANPEQTRIRFVIRCDSEDIGRIIGKQGRIIRAVRDLVKLIAAKEHVFADVVLADEI